MNPMLTLVRADGARFVFENTFEETEIDGAGTLIREIYSEAKGIGNGNVKTGSRIPPRSIVISTCSVGADLNGENRRLIDTFVLPEEKYKLIVNYKGTERWIEGELEVMELPLEYIREPQQFNFNLYCVDPLFRSMDEFGKDIANITPTFGFPIMSPLPSVKPYSFGGNVVGVYDFTRTVFIANAGDFETFPRIVVQASATVTDFCIRKNEKEYVKIIGNLVKGDVVEIDFGEQSVTKNGVNINRLIDRKSTFFMIDRGGVNVKYEAVQGDNSVKVSIFYNQLYKGV